MKNGAKTLLVATLICVAAYIGIYIGRNHTGTIVTVDVNNGNSVTLNTMPAESTPLLININTASVQELVMLHALSESAAQNIVSYRENYGRFLSLWELLEVDGITERILDEIWPYITVGG